MVNFCGCAKKFDLTPQYVYAVSGDKVNLRAKPGRNQPVIEVVNNGQGLEILDISENITEEHYPNYDFGVPMYWYKVKTETGNVGYISRQYINLLLGHKKEAGLIGTFEQIEKGKLKATTLSILQDGVVREPDSYDFIQSKSISRVPKKLSIDYGIVLSSDQKNIGEIKDVKFAADYTKEKESGCWEGYYFSGIYNGLKPAPSSLIIIGLSGTSESSIDFKDFTDRTIIKTIENASALMVRKKSPDDFKGENFLCVSGDKCIYKSVKNNGNEYIISTQTIVYPDKSGHSQVFRIDKILQNKIETLYYHDSIGGKKEVPDRETAFAITDLDKNGILEIFTVTHGYEWWFYRIYSLEKDRVIPVFNGAGGGC
ncbi:SH3 domain-containing protein [Leptospira neocaledonica]|uniref:SH3 domain-containing protein n=1 Tax=Leptospira neocaledonica TaxID=2023192 RepID=UPI001FCBF26B|nr:SH3 domain-containing protein [Leptospira neocaledonica]